MDEKFSNYALMLKALSDANRLLIINNLIDGECCACKILEQLNITQPTLSHHMKILCDNNLVIARKEGKWMHYSLNHIRFHEIIKFLENFNQGFVYN